MKFNGITAVVTEVAEDGGFYFQNQVSLMPCIRSGIAASLAGHLWDPGATLLSSNFPWPSGSALCQDDIVEFSEI